MVAQHCGRTKSHGSVCFTTVNSISCEFHLNFIFFFFKAKSASKAAGTFLPGFLPECGRADILRDPVQTLSCLFFPRVTPSRGQK